MNTQIYEEASDWIVKNREGDLAARDKERFDAWLRESPQHLRAYLEMSAVWEDVGEIDPSLNAAADELIAGARAEDNIVPLKFPSTLQTGEGRETSRLKATTPTVRKMGLYAALAASVLVTITGTWFYGQRNMYSTGIGEQRSIVLSDGSTLELNSRSRVRVRFSDAGRDVDLIEGQALFRVAKNPLRPFIVNTDGAHVRAVGTQFDVYRKASGTIVTVVEGRVAVFGESADAGGPTSSRNANASTLPVQAPGEGMGSLPERGDVPEHGDSQNDAVFLAAGEQVTVTPRSAAPLPKRANVAAATAWTQRSLVFDSSPLSEVAEEFNRYNTRQLVIEDSQLGDIHVSGVFSSVDPGLLLRFLRTQPELAIAETDREIRIFRK